MAGAELSPAKDVRGLSIPKERTRPVCPTDPTNGRSRPRDRVARPAVTGPLGLLHPFPSGLNAIAVATLALVAGGSAATAAAAAVAMALLQTSIGCVNDLCDLEFDRLAHPGKPLPSGRVGRRTAIGYAIAAGVSGIVLAAVLGPPVAAIAAVGFAIGLLYDTRLSRTPWSWLPFAMGLPLVPAFGWAAARSELPAAFPELIVLGTLAGAALAIANGLADLDADAAVDGGGLAFQLGRRASLLLLVVLQASLVILAAAVVLDGRRSPSSIAPLVFAVPVIVLGVVASRATSAVARERGWEAQAVGVALLAIAWLVATQPGVLA
jgi:4-hydroxybenzoate polyprenyltransferase